MNGLTVKDAPTGATIDMPNRAKPDVCNEAEYERWKQEAGSIRERCLSAEKLIAEARKRC